MDFGNIYFSLIYMDLRKAGKAIEYAPYNFLYREQIYVLNFLEKHRMT